MKLVQFHQIIEDDLTGTRRREIFLRADSFVFFRRADSADGEATAIYTEGGFKIIVEEPIREVFDKLFSGGGRVILDRDDPPPPYLKGLDKPEKKPTRITLGLDPKAFGRAVYNLTHKGAGEGPEEPDPDSYEE